MRIVASGFVLPEAPVVAPDGSAYISDLLGGGVRRLDLDGRDVGVLVPGRRGIGGAALDVDGGLLLTGRDIVRVHPDTGKSQVVLRSPENVTGFNDLGVTPDGTVIVGAVTCRPLAGEPLTPAELHAIDGRHGHRIWDAGTLSWPNGIVADPAGDRVYVAETHTGVIYVSPWPSERADLRPYARTPTGQADGMAIDAGGTLYVALGGGGGVARFDRAGELVDVVTVPAMFTSSVCFVDATRELLITTADHTGAPDLGGCVMATVVSAPGSPVPPAPHLAGLDSTA